MCFILFELLHENIVEVDDIVCSSEAEMVNYIQEKYNCRVRLVPNHNRILGNFSKYEMGCIFIFREKPRDYTRKYISKIDDADVNVAIGKEQHKSCFKENQFKHLPVK